MINKIYTMFLILGFATGLNAQKPQKTFNHEKFANKVYGNFSANMNPTVFLPDGKALAFISAKTNIPIEKLRQEQEQIKQWLEEDVARLRTENIGGLMISKFELKPVADPQLTKGNIIIEINTSKGLKRIELANCIQTDVTWVLGDYIGLEGQKPTRVKEPTSQERINTILASSEKNYESLLKPNTWETQVIILVNDEHKEGMITGGKHLMNKPYYWYYFQTTSESESMGSMFQGEKEINKLGTKYVIDQNKGTLSFYEADKLVYEFLIRSIEENQLITTLTIGSDLYHFVLYRSQPHVVETKPEEAVESGKPKELYKATYSSSDINDPSTAYVRKDLFGKPVKGYYITKDGKKVEAVIKYQEPEQLQSHTSTLLLYKKAYNESGFTEDETNNFTTALMKSEIIAFYVEGYLYVPVQQSSGTQWHILLSEGSVRESVWIGTLKKDGKTLSYVVNTFIHKHGGAVLEIKSMALSFKNQMSEFLSDNTEIAAKIKNKEQGYGYMQYQKIVKEYNAWFEEQYPGKNIYMYK